MVSQLYHIIYQSQNLNHNPFSGNTKCMTVKHFPLLIISSRCSESIPASLVLRDKAQGQRRSRLL